MKTMKSFKPEILAPVGSWDMLLAAVRSGADAVYLGAENFNARRRAENFTPEQLKDAVRLCRESGVKVYLTLNTCVGDEEIKSAVETAEKAFEAGIDAAIVADLGLASALKTALPELPLHASTQTSVLSVSALDKLCELGFSRVVVGREMSREQIREFAKKASERGIETEVFVHGALCMCVSGQCLLSSIIGGRSGNRGLCAGPCRLPFSGSGSEYALSLKDLSLLEYVEELASAGVASLKIEGRMKRPEYVAAAVTAFRHAVDGEDYSSAQNMLSSVFSRSGFTDGYYTGKTGADMFGIRTREDVLSSGEVLNEIHSLYRSVRQRVPISLGAEIKAGAEARLVLSDGENSVSVTGAVPQAAKNKALDEEAVKNSLGKLGGTPYFAKKIDIELDDGLFLPASELNFLRRAAVEQLGEKRMQCPAVKKREINLDFADKKREKAELYCRFENIGQIPENLEGIALVCLPLGADFAEAARRTKVPLAVEIPRAAASEAAVAVSVEKAREQGVKIAFCGTLAALELAQNAGLRAIADIGFNIYNSQSAAVLEKLGAEAVMASAELTSKQINSLKTPLSKGVFAYGRLPLMLTKNCPVGHGGCGGCERNRSITDRTGAEFPVRCYSGYSVVYNGKPHYLADRLPEFSADFFYLYFTTEEKAEAAEIIRAYKNGEKPTGEFTRGLYFREVY